MVSFESGLRRGFSGDIGLPDPRRGLRPPIFAQAVVFHARRLSRACVEIGRRGTTERQKSSENVIADGVERVGSGGL